VPLLDESLFGKVQEVARIMREDGKRVSTGLV
jgi:hypothetical protein